MNSIGYLIKQGFKNTLNNGIMSLASIGVLLSCLLLIGTSTLLSLNANKIISDIEHQNEIVVFLNDDIDEYQINNISIFFQNTKSIDTFEFVDKDEALKNHIEIIGSEPSLFESLKDDNPLPDTYNVVLSDLSQIDKLISQIESLDGVSKVNAPVEVAKMIVSIKHFINIAGIIIISILIIVSLIIISNTIKLTIYSRRKEINIMKFVGASDFFINLPFIVEGVFLGVTSAILAHIILWLSYNYIISQISNINLQWVINLYNNIIPFSKYSLYIFACSLGIGIFVGLIGSVIFVRKYLRV